MTRGALPSPILAIPARADILELSKPITWFPPMWAFGCGVLSSGIPVLDRWQFLIAGLLLAGPLVCGTSQVVNDWFDRHVDAINEPQRPIPSGRIPGRWGLALAIIGTGLALIVGLAAGLWVFAATIAGLVFAWLYSAPPLRLKADGRAGPAVVALCYEGLPWFTGAAVMAGALPDGQVLAVLLLYSAGAYGIMTLNDFKSITGDRMTGVRSLPAMLGPRRAGRIACVAMTIPQVVVVALLRNWGMPYAALAVGLSLVIQLILMRRLLTDPKRLAPWYNATGTTLYVLGMAAAAAGLGNAS